MDIPRLLAVVRARAGFLAVVALAAAGAAFAVSLQQPDRFQASADVLFGRTTLAESLIAGSNSDTAPPEGQAADRALASLNTVAARVAQRFSAPATPAEIKDAVDVELRGTSDLATVTAQWSTPALAARLANVFADEMVALRRETARREIQRAIDALNTTLAGPQSAGGTGSSEGQLQVLRDRIAQLEVLKNLQTGDVEVVERATPPAERSSPKPVRNAIAATLGALIIGLSVVALLARSDQRIRDEDELASLIDAPVLARIPGVPRFRRAVGRGAAQQGAAFDEAFEFLRLNLELVAPETGGLVVAVTSPAAGDGKTTVVARLARALASGGVDVVAVDFDLRNPTLHSLFDVPRRRGYGVVDALLEPGSGDDLTQGTSQPHLRMLSAGAQRAVPPSGLINPGRLAHMLGRLRDRTEYVLVDTPPVSSVADASAIATAADGVILVIDLASVRRDELLAAEQQLTNARATIVGLVLNRVSARSPAYHQRERGRAPAAGQPARTPPTFAGSNDLQPEPQVHGRR